MKESRTYTEKIYDEGADALTALMFFFERVRSKMGHRDEIVFVKVNQDTKTGTKKDVEVGYILAVVKVANEGEEVSDVQGE